MHLSAHTQKIRFSHLFEQIILFSLNFCFFFFTLQIVVWLQWRWSICDLPLSQFLAKIERWTYVNCSKNPHIIVWQSGSMKITTYLLWFPLCVHRVHHLIVHRIPFKNFLFLHTSQHMCNRNRNQEQAYTTCTMYNICSYSNLDLRFTFFASFFSQVNNNQWNDKGNNKRAKNKTEKKKSLSGKEQHTRYSHTKQKC